MSPNKANYYLSCYHQLAEHPLVGDIRQRGLIAAIELVADKENGVPRPFPATAKICLFKGKGRLVKTLRDTLVIMPFLSISGRNKRPKS